jgi:hypothetical protein
MTCFHHSHEIEQLTAFAVGCLLLNLHACNDTLSLIAIAVVHQVQHSQFLLGRKIHTSWWAEKQRAPCKNEKIMVAAYDVKSSSCFKNNRYKLPPYSRESAILVRPSTQTHTFAENSKAPSNVPL